MYQVAIRSAYDSALFIPGLPGRSGRTHGHRYTVEAVVEGSHLDSFGFVLDFDWLKARLDELTQTLDHHVLNELPEFGETSPSSENQARYFYRELKAALEQTGAAAKLRYVKVTQEPNAWAMYWE